MAQEIITKSLAPTMSHGDRVKATCWNSSVTIAWSYQLDTYGNHRAAAEELVKKLNAKMDAEFKIVAGGALPDQSGYAFIVA